MKRISGSNSDGYVNFRCIRVCDKKKLADLQMNHFLQLESLSLRKIQPGEFAPGDFIRKFPSTEILPSQWNPPRGISQIRIPLDKISHIEIST